MSNASLTKITRIFAPWAECDDEPELLRTETDTISMVPDGFDIENGLVDHVAVAIDCLRNSAFVTYASTEPHSMANARTWFDVEGYSHPYTGELEEVSYHFADGFSDAEARVVVEGTFAK